MRTHTLTMTVLTSVLALGAVGLSGCGNDDPASAPTDASVSEFCDSFTELDDFDSDASIKEQIQQAKDAVGSVRDVGTPSDMPDDVREGYEKLLSSVEDLDDDASAEDLDKLLGSGDEKQVQAFLTYFGETCSTT